MKMNPSSRVTILLVGTFFVALAAPGCASEDSGEDVSESSTEVSALGRGCTNGAHRSYPIDGCCAPGKAWMGDEYCDGGKWWYGGQYCTRRVTSCSR